MALKQYTFDIAARRLELVSTDGSGLCVPAWDLPSPDQTGVRRATVDLAAAEMELTFDRGHSLTVDTLGATAAATFARSTPIVYLDQLHWITLARRLHAPGKVAERDRAAAARLLDLAEQRRVLLPVSAAHLVEAGPLWGKRRSDLVTTMLGLSRGWFMREVVAIRALELGASMRGDEPDTDGIFGLEPDAIFGQPIVGPDPPGLPSRWARLYRRTLEVIAVYDSMLDDAAINDAAGSQAAASWAEAQAVLARHLRDRRAPREITDEVAHAQLLADLTPEIVTAARDAELTLAQGKRWLDCSRAAIDRLPFLARSRQLLFERLRNADDRWHANDLFDMHYLAAAAGYADIVVGEKKTSEYLGRVRDRVPSGAIVCRTLPAAVAHVEAMLCARSV